MNGILRDVKDWLEVVVCYIFGMGYIYSNPIFCQHDLTPLGTTNINTFDFVGSRMGLDTILGMGINI